MTEALDLGTQRHESFTHITDVMKTEGSSMSINKNPKRHFTYLLLPNTGRAAWIHSEDITQTTYQNKVYECGYPPNKNGKDWTCQLIIPNLQKGLNMACNV